MSKPTFFYREIDEVEREKLNNAKDKLIDLMQELGLEPWECYLVVKCLWEGFPTEYLVRE